MNRFLRVLTLSGLLLCFAQTLYGQSLDFVSAYRIGDNGDDEAYKVALDPDGNLYVTGYFSDSIDLDPGTGTSWAYSTGVYDLFLIKLSFEGHFIWGKVILGTDHVLGYGLCTDQAGNVFLGGNFKGTVDFNPGPATSYQTSSGSTDIFILKLDSAGDFKWVRCAGFNGSEGIYDLETDTLGNVYATGFFHNVVDFNPGTGTYNLTALSSANTFVWKLSNSGTFMWARSIESTGLSYGYELNFDLNGHIYITGYAYGTIDFDPGTGTYIHAPGMKSDAYVLKLNQYGHFIRVFLLESSIHAVARSVRVDPEFGIYVCGYFKGLTDFDPDTSQYLMQSNFECGFVCKFDSTGKFNWAHQLGLQSHNERTLDIEMDPGAALYVSGFFRSTLDFNFDPNISEMRTSAGGTDFYLLKIDSSGHFIWVATGGGAGADMIEDLCTDGNGEIYAAGHYTGKADFNPGNDTFYLSSSNSSDDGFLWHLSECVTNYTTAEISACGSYSWTDGNTYTTSVSGLVDTLVNYKGCDSIVSLNLSINQPNSSIDLKTACDSFTWIDGQVFYQDTFDVFDTLINSSGCDSLVSLELTIHKSNYSVHDVTACDFYTWVDGLTYDSSIHSATHTLINSQGCDSILFLNLTVNHRKFSIDSMVVCDSITWVNGQKYTASTFGQVSDTFISSSGCDSIVTLNLTVNHSSITTDSINSACDSFIWIDGKTYFTSNQTASHLTQTDRGCDSLIYLSLTLNHSRYRKEQISYCRAFIWVDGNTYTTDTSQVYYRFSNVTGCDSILELELEITPMNLQISRNGMTLSVQQTGSAYQWFSCDSNGLVLIPGANQSTYFISGNGYFAIEVTHNNCIDTSTCFSVTGVGLNEVNSSSDIRVFPNPSKGKIHVQIAPSLGTGHLSVVDLTGKQIQSLVYSGNGELLLDLPGKTTLYWLVFESDKGVFRVLISIH